MKLRIIGWLGLVLGASVLRGAETSSSAAMFDEQYLRDMEIRREEARAPKLDPKRIINESNSFLKEREPEMNAEEYALYEKVVVMLATNPQFALRLLEGMINEKEPPSPAFEFILGNAYYSTGDTAKAESSYRSAVKRYPNFLRAWVNLAMLYYSASRFDEAIPCLTKAVTLGDRDTATFGLLGFSLEQTGNIVSAEMAYMQALASDPSNGDWKEGLLRIYIHGRQYGRAEWLVKTLIKERPKEGRFWLTYANILIADGRKLGAVAVLESCSGLGFAGPDELNLLGDLYAEQALYPEALAIYTKILKPAPETGENKLLHFAQVLIAGDRLGDAERVLAALPANLSATGRIDFLQARADLLAARRSWPEARAELNELLKLAPLNGRALLSLGRAFLAENDTPRATFAFESALKVPATAHRANLELANLEIKARHYSRSVEYLEAALSLEKTDAVADYLARIKALVGKPEPAGEGS